MLSIKIYFHVSSHEFFNMASDWLATELTASQKPGLKILGNQYGFFHGNFLVTQASDGESSMIVRGTFTNNLIIIYHISISIQHYCCTNMPPRYKQNTTDKFTKKGQFNFANCCACHPVLAKYITSFPFRYTYH